MIQIERSELSYDTEEALENYQAEIDGLEYPKQVEKAQKIWANRRKNDPFTEIKEKLIEMCSGPRRCHYCEDSAADEIEHIWPKSYFPERTFIWENFLYICGACNIAKGNKWDLFVEGAFDLERVTLTRKQGDDILPPPENGDPLFIDPTEEDPFDFLFLDLTMDDERLEFCPVDVEEGSFNFQIAQFTIDTLKLNERADLSRSRFVAYTNYRARLSEYVTGSQNGTSKEKLANMIKQLKMESHPTVWHSIIHYRNKGWLVKVDTDFDFLFDKAPEALTWL